MRADGARHELTDPHNEAAKWHHTVGRLQRELRQLRDLSLDDAVIWVTQNAPNAPRQGTSERRRRQRATPASKGRHEPPARYPEARRPGP